MCRIRIMIVDDNATFREQLKEFLASELQIEVVGEAADGQEAVEAAQKQQPALILMDILMPRRETMTNT